MIYYRHRVVSQEECINLLWGDGEPGANPSGAFKTMVHRLRTMLDTLWPTAGHDLILHQNGGYIWNKEAKVVLDIEKFDELCCKGNLDEEEQIQCDFQALQLYQGDFLSHMSSEAWVIPVAAYYRNCYIQSVLRVVPVLFEQKRYNEAVELCQTASNREPFHEEIHCYLMEALLYKGDQKGAANVYMKISERLSSNFGIMPSEEMRALYYKSIRVKNDHVLSINMIQEQLQEESQEGALICEYEFFRVLYRLMARSMARNGMAIHIALLTVIGEEVSKRQQKIMKNLQEQIRLSLRRGDVAAQCSASQYIILLPQANYENSCMVCERIVKAFFHKYPHYTADIQYAVYPVKPEEEMT